MKYFEIFLLELMATNFSPSSGSYVLNKFPSISQWSDTGPSWPSCFILFKLIWIGFIQFGKQKMQAILHCLFPTLFSTQTNTNLDLEIFIVFFLSIMLAIKANTHSCLFYPPLWKYDKYLSQTTNFRLFQTQRVCRWQFFKIWGKWRKVFWKGRKHCWKRRNCLLRAISPFPTVVSKDLFCRHMETRACLGMG